VKQEECRRFSRFKTLVLWALQQSYNSPEAGGVQDIESRPAGASAHALLNQLGSLPVSGSLATGPTDRQRVTLVIPAPMIEGLSVGRTLLLVVLVPTPSLAVLVQTC
jgi:hypothetical protein